MEDPLPAGDAPPLRLTAHSLGTPPPTLRPAPARRDWMDATPEAFANRCLPLTIANAHGWEVVGECGFEAWWNGGPDASDITIRREGEGRPAPVSHFGSGVLTFHIDLVPHRPRRQPLGLRPAQPAQGRHRAADRASSRPTGRPPPSP